jgi:hypothetical protein
MSHGLVIASTGSHSSSSSLTSPIQKHHPELELAVFLFIHGAFSLANCLLLYVQLSLELFSSSPFE